MSAALTITGSVVFPGHVVRPDTHYPASPAYTLVLNVPCNERSILPYIQAVQQAAEARFGPMSLRGTQMPVEVSDDRMQVRFRTKDRPRLLDAAGRYIAAGSEIQSGEEVTVVAQVETWAFNDKRGVSLRMLSVQRVGPPVSAKASPPATPAAPVTAGTVAEVDPFVFEPEDVA